MNAPVRIDSFLWAVRLFKTRSLAQEACRKGRISINGSVAKPAKTVAPGDKIEVRKPPVTFSFKVLQTAANRMGAKLVPEYLLNITPPEQYDILKMQQISGYIDRAKGLGRPTKKERRDLEQFYTDVPEGLTPAESLPDDPYPHSYQEAEPVNLDWLREEDDEEEWDNW